MLKEFRSFLLRGNVVDLAVAVVVGTAFTALVTALVTDLVTPIIAAVVGKHDFSNLEFMINGSAFRYGSFLNALITFVSVATAVFFFVVVPVNTLMRARRGAEEKAADTHPCTECLSEIPRPAKRCAFCGSPQAPAPAA